MRNRIFTVALLLALALPATGALAQDDLIDKVNSGWAALQKGDLTVARAAFQDVIDASPVYDFGWYALGQVATREGKLDEAITDFNKAIEINPEKFEYHYGLAAAFRTKEEYAKAIATMNNAESLATAPQTQYYLYLERGISYLSIRQWDRAAADLEEAVKLQPEDKMVNQRLGMALFRMDDFKRAAEHLQKAVAADPKDGVSQLYLARTSINLAQREQDAARKKGYYADGVKAAMAANTLSPGFDAQNTLAKAYLGSGQYEQAARSFQKVVQAKPKYCVARTNLGQAYVGMKAFGQAVTALEKAVDCDPKSTISLNTLAFAYVKENKKDLALSSYETSFKLKADPSVAINMEKVAKNIEIDQENQIIDSANEETKKRNEAEQAAFDKKQADYEAEQKRIKAYKEKDN